MMIVFWDMKGHDDSVLDMKGHDDSVLGDERL